MKPEETVMASVSMIEVKDLTKRYGQVVANDSISFSVRNGEIVGLLGPNGAGKTTVMRILTGCIAATSGTASVGGYELSTHATKAKRQIGYLPEFVPVYPDMTVTEYLDFLGALRDLRGRMLRTARDGVIERCGLGEMRRRLVKNLSKGYQQRLGLAQALIHNPAVLILDEPTGGLDPRQTNEMRQLISKLAGQHTILLSTHILPEATALCQRVIIMHKGRIAAVDEQERLAARLRKSEKLTLRLHHPPPDIVDEIKSIPGVIGIYSAADWGQGRSGGTGERRWIVECELGKDLAEEIARRAVQRAWGLAELTPLSLSLEEVFLNLTNSDTIQAPS
jgi:ABC-2 type transport system ATP-binding protein